MYNRRQIKDKNWDGVVKQTGASIQEARGSMKGLIGRKFTLIVWRGFRNHWISPNVTLWSNGVWSNLAYIPRHGALKPFWWLLVGPHLMWHIVNGVSFFISLINTRDSSFTTQRLMIILNNCFVCHRLAAPYPEKLQVTAAPQEQLLKMGLEKRIGVLQRTWKVVWWERWFAHFIWWSGTAAAVETCCSWGRQYPVLALFHISLPLLPATCEFPLLPTIPLT